MALDLPPVDFLPPPPMPPPPPPQDEGGDAPSSRPTSTTISAISPRSRSGEPGSMTASALWRNPNRPSDSINLKGAAVPAGAATLRRQMMLSPRGGSGIQRNDGPDTIMPVKSAMAPDTLRRSNTIASLATVEKKTQPSATMGSSLSPAEMLERRQKIVKEILTSEVSYVGQLDKILEDMKLVRGASMVQAKQVARIFGNIEMVHGLHSKQFLPELKSRLRAFSEKTPIGDLFLTQLPYFKAVYTQYVSNYSNALEALRQLMTVSGFVEYVKGAWVGEGTVPFDMHLRSLLITPVQRIPRYELLLKDLVRATEATHPDLQNITQAQANMQAVAEWANEKKGDADRMLQLIELSGALRSELQRESVVLAKPGRNYLCEATFTQPRPKDKPPRITNLHVFSDCILIARRKEGSDARSFDGLIYIKALRVDVLSDICIVLNTDKDVLSPVGQSETKKWYLTAASAQDCSGFVNIIAKLKTDIQRKEADGKARPKHKLHVAVKRCDLDAVKECLRGGNQDVNVQDHKGRTPLHIAIKKRENPIISALLAAGASTKIVANDGTNPYDIAMRLGYEESMLQQLGWPRIGSPRNNARTSPIRRASPGRAVAPQPPPSPGRKPSPSRKDRIIEESRAEREMPPKEKHKSPIFGATLDKIFRKMNNVTSGSSSSSSSASSATPALDKTNEEVASENPLLGTAPVLWNPAARSPRQSVQMPSSPTSAAEYGEAQRKLERVDARLAELMREVAELQAERAQLVKVLEKSAPRPLSSSLMSDGPALV